MGMFDKLLAEVEESDRPIFQKYPKIAQKIDAQGEYNARWEKWKAEQWVEEQKMPKNAIQVIQQKDAEIEALKLLQGDGVNWDEMKGNIETMLDARLRAQKYATPDDVKGYLEKEVSPKLTIKSGDRDIPVTQYVQNLERGMERTYALTAHLPQEYREEFRGIADAPKFTIESLFKHMQEKSISNFDDAYNSMVAPLRAKKAEADRAAEIEKIKAEAKAEAKKEVMMSQGTMPTDDQGGSSLQTPLQLRIQARAAKQNEQGAPKLTPGTLGDGTAGRDAYTAYLKDQAAGTKPQMIQ